MFISSMWYVKEPTHYSKKVGHQVPGVATVLCESIAGPHQLIAAKTQPSQSNKQTTINIQLRCEAIFAGRHCFLRENFLAPF